MLKHEIRKFSVAFSKKKCKEKRENLACFEQKLKELEQNLNCD